MQNPLSEIANVIKLLVSPASLDLQSAAIEKYFTTDAGFRHPLLYVPPGPNSRPAIIGTFQCNYLLSPHTTVDCQSIVYDESQKALYVELTQKYHVRFSPFPITPARLLCRFTLIEVDSVYLISYHEDFLHPDTIFAMFLPPLAPLVRLILRDMSMAMRSTAAIDFIHR